MFEVNLASYHKLNGNNKIPRCYGDSYLVQKDGMLYVAQVFYQSMIKDDVDRGVSAYHCEINAMNRLNNGVKSILKYYGYNNNNRGLHSKSVILLEYINGKSLQEVKKTELSDTNRFKIIIGIGLGMKYAHSKGVCHRDLSTENILLDSNLEPKICNFESSKILEDTTIDELTTTVRGKIAYMDPNIYDNDDDGYNPKLADVYSFAYIMYYVLGGNDVINLRKSLSNFDKRPCLNGIDDRFHQLISSCWSTDEETRPSFNTIVERLLNREMWLGDEKEIEDYIGSFDPELLKNPDIIDVKVDMPKLAKSVEDDKELDKKEIPKSADTSDDKETKIQDDNLEQEQNAQPIPKPKKKKKSTKSFIPKTRPA